MTLSRTCALSKESSYPDMPISFPVMSYTIQRSMMTSYLSWKYELRLMETKKARKKLWQSDCCTRTASGLLLGTTVSKFRRWRIERIYVWTAFLKRCLASRRVYVIPPEESKRNNEMCLLLSAPYWLVAITAKWKVNSDGTIEWLYLVQYMPIPQKIMLFDVNGQFVSSLIKTGDDILATGTYDALRSFTVQLGNSFKLGDTSSGRGRMRVFRLNIYNTMTFSALTMEIKSYKPWGPTFYQKCADVNVMLIWILSNELRLCQLMRVSCVLE